MYRFSLESVCRSVFLFFDFATRNRTWLVCHWVRTVHSNPGHDSNAYAYTHGYRLYTHGITYAHTQSTKSLPHTHAQNTQTRPTHIHTYSTHQAPAPASLRTHHTPPPPNPTYLHLHTHTSPPPPPKKQKNINSHTSSIQSKTVKITTNGRQDVRRSGGAVTHTSDGRSDNGRRGRPTRRPLASPRLRGGG